MVVTATKAREGLFKLIQQVNDDQVAVQITSNNGNAVLISESEYEAIMETLHLTTDPEAMASIRRGLADISSGRTVRIAPPTHLMNAPKRTAKKKAPAKKAKKVNRRLVAR